MVHGNTFPATGLGWNRVRTPAEVIGYDTVYTATAAEIDLRLTGKWVPGCSAHERVWWLHTNDETTEPVGLGGPCLPPVALNRATHAIRRSGRTAALRAAR